MNFKLSGVGVVGTYISPTHEIQCKRNDWMAHLVDNLQDGGDCICWLQNIKGTCFTQDDAREDLNGCAVDQLAEDLAELLTAEWTWRLVRGLEAWQSHLNPSLGIIFSSLKLLVFKRCV